MRLRIIILIRKFSVRVRVKERGAVMKESESRRKGRTCYTDTLLLLYLNDYYILAVIDKP